MTLHKITTSKVERVITGDEIKTGALEESSTPITPGIYNEVQAVYVMSVKYAMDVEVFLKMVSALKTIGDPHIRAAMLDSISGLLSEIGMLAAQICKSDEEIFKASSEVIMEKIMLPTVKLRESIAEMRTNNKKTVGLDKAISMVDSLMDAINVRSISTDDGTQYCSGDRDSTN